MIRDSATRVAGQFDDARQQHDAATLGMWMFLATEVLFFGGLFMAYLAYRTAMPDGFAEGSRHTIVLFGTINTAILLTSSLTMALAVNAAESGRSRAILRNLVLTLLLGVAFLVVKAFEYRADLAEGLLPGSAFDPGLSRGAEMFFYLYWAMTGLHAVHVIVGLGLLSVLAVLARRGRFSAAYFTPLEMGGLYWHFVDIVWLFLYPLLYLVGRHG